MSLLYSIQHLTLNFPHKLIFSDVSLDMRQGQKVGLIGLNGHGKSSLLKIIAEELYPDKTTPAFIFDKSKDFSFFYVPQELKNLNDVDVENYFYEFYPNLKDLRVRLDKINSLLLKEDADFDKLIHEQTQLLEKMRSLGDDRLHSQYLSYLKSFGPIDPKRKMSSLSGGEQKKVALSLGLSAPQELILWDEPTNHLDLETIELLEEELQNSKKSFMIISHDRSLLNNVVDKIFHIQRGKLKSFDGTYEQYLEYLKDEELRKEKELDRLVNTNRRETAWIRRGVQARRTKSKKRIEDYDSLQKKISDLKNEAHKSVDLNLQSSGRKTKVLISAENIGQAFQDKKLFEGLNLVINKGDKISLLGSNGAGKSTLLKILIGELNPTEGKVNRAVNLEVGHFSQKREILKDNDTPWSLIGEGIDYVISNTGDKKHVASYLENFLFSSDELKRPIHTFSGGERNRLQLAQFMKHSKDIWIFDEPTNDLDLETIGILEEELRNYEGALIVVGHDRTFISNVTEKCWVLDNKGIEIFEAGFSQAEKYLEANRLEKSIPEVKVTTSNSSSNPSSKPRPSNKEKQRYDQIGPEMARLEEKIQILKDKLVENYNEQDSQELVGSEKKLEELFEEWMILESKFN